MSLASVCSSSTTARNAEGSVSARHVGDVEGGDGAIQRSAEG
jgi:hypothetical protein